MRSQFAPLIEQVAGVRFLISTSLTSMNKYDTQVREGHRWPIITRNQSDRLSNEHMRIPLRNYINITKTSAGYMMRLQHVLPYISKASLRRVISLYTNANIRKDRKKGMLLPNHLGLSKRDVHVLCTLCDFCFLGNLCVEPLRERRRRP